MKIIIQSIKKVFKSVFVAWQKQNEVLPGE